MKNLQFGENRLVFMGFGTPKGGSEAAPKSSEIPKDQLIKLTKSVLKTGPNPKNSELKQKAKDFIKKHESNPFGRTDEIKTAIKGSTDPKVAPNQVDNAADKIDRAITRLAMTRLDG